MEEGNYYQLSSAVTSDEWVVENLGIVGSSFNKVCNTKVCKLTTDSFLETKIYKIAATAKPK
ncbi:MAG: hypothetical protein AABY22_28230 [Nanoarchaeota archaeon]